MATTQRTTGQRPGGRSAAVLSALKTAVEELVAERGSERVTIPMVAERAGVNPSSVYRRWGDLATMINDVATYRLDPHRRLPDSGDLVADLTAWAEEVQTHYSDPTRAALLRGGAASAGERESDCLRDRRAEAEIILGNAVADNSGLSVDDVIDGVLAPIIYRVIFLPWTLDERTARTLVERLVQAHGVAVG